jgi:D-lyxose ketol-isomerase
MIRRWLIYLIALIGCLALFMANQGWFAWLLLLCVLWLPVLSLVVSLPAILSIQVQVGNGGTVPAGTQVKLTPGESITIYPYMYHDFYVEEGSGDVLLGEVSMCNDDENDNRFYEPIGRFPEIEEDEEPYRLLCNEYPKA